MAMATVPPAAFPPSPQSPPPAGERNRKRGAGERDGWGSCTLTRASRRLRKRAQPPRRLPLRQAQGRLSPTGAGEGQEKRTGHPGIALPLACLRRCARQVGLAAVRSAPGAGMTEVGRPAPACHPRAWPLHGSGDGDGLRRGIALPLVGQAAVRRAPRARGRGGRAAPARGKIAFLRTPAAAENDVRASTRR